eukprot:6188157-Pleurochrysis_carterae.AAC.1
MGKAASRQPPGAITAYSGLKTTLPAVRRPHAPAPVDLVMPAQPQQLAEAKTLLHNYNEYNLFLQLVPGRARDT